MKVIEFDEAVSADLLVGAGCILDTTEMPARLREWADLRDRSMAVRPIDGGVALSLSPSEPIGPIAELAARESECCAFYSFLLRIDGPTRELEISAGEGREVAVQVLLGLPEGS